VGDIPVHVGDYVSQSGSPPTLLTTVDENRDLEAYIYIPTERSAQVRMGLPVDLNDNNGKLLEKTRIDFVSPEVDSNLQGILVKAPVQSSLETLRNAQMIKADVIWSTKPMAVVPVLAVTQQGEQSFVFELEEHNGMSFAHRAPVTLGATVGNDYSIVSGLNAGDRVIVSATQFLVDGMPVIPMAGPPGPPSSQGKGAGAHAMSSGTENKSGGDPAKVAAQTQSGTVLAKNGGPHRAASHRRHRRHRRALARKSKQSPHVTVS
jgi:multidrug efflux pump subunit AcrA (membrane-fusion protein)